ncbi:MAG TPA: 3-oxoacyl-[acyl-carrier-protein] synthase III C-terminal domain-containing protein [Kofleriaceae bacterium]
MNRLRAAPRPRDRVSEIVATGFAYPHMIVDNDGFFARCRFPISNDREALIAETRMVRRTWCGLGENTWTMAREAVHRALAQGPVAPDEIDLVVVSSCSTIPMVSYPDPKNPVVADLAPLVLAELGRDDAVGIDLKATYCAGFLRALELCAAPRDRLVWSGDVTGYAQSASIAATLGARLADRTMAKGDLVLSLAAGTGMNVAGALYHC